MSTVGGPGDPKTGRALTCSQVRELCCHMGMEMFEGKITLPSLCKVITQYKALKLNCI